MNKFLSLFATFAILAVKLLFILPKNSPGRRTCMGLIRPIGHMGHIGAMRRARMNVWSYYAGKLW